MRPGKRWATAAHAPSKSLGDLFVEVIRNRLSAGNSVERPWNDDDERRFQKVFDRPSPHAHKLSGEPPHA